MRRKRMGEKHNRMRDLYLGCTCRSDGELNKKTAGKDWGAPKEDKNKKPGRVVGREGPCNWRTVQTTGISGVGIDQSAGRLAPALDNSCPAENPSQLRKICRQSAGTRRSIRQKRR